MSRRAEPGLVITGLGLRPGPDTTLDALRALAACDRVFHDCGEAGAALLRRHCRRVARAPAAAAIVASARSRRVGLACALTPPWGGALADECRRLCAKEGVPVTAVAAISPLGAVVAQAAAFFGGGPFGALGLQCFEAGSALALRPELTPWLPLVVYAEGPGPHPWAEVAAWLRGAYAPGHRVKACAEDGEPMAALRLDELHRLSAAAVFIPPARKGAERPAGPGAGRSTVRASSPRAGRRR